VGHIEPGVEVVARTHLTLERDPYLEDHVYNGSHLLPTVFGLEAMAQAAAYAVGATELGTLRVEDVRLERPIVAHPVEGVSIEIRAEVLERETADGERRVRTSIGTERTGFARDHFSATFVLGVEVDAPNEQIDLPEAPLDVRPTEDLYSWLLFQGPRFQRLRAVHSLDSDGCAFTTEALPETTEPYLLGDPFFRDTLLQSGQLTAPQDLCLPVHIERIEVYPTRRAPGLRTAVAYDKVQGERFIDVSVVAVDDEGRVVERLEGYRSRILEHRDENPTAEEIAEPGERDAALLRRELAENARAFGVAAPEASIAYVPGIHAHSREERHTLELPVVNETVARVLANRKGMPDG
jgi:enediyne polyketide synthase